MEESQIHLYNTKQIIFLHKSIELCESYEKVKVLYFGPKMATMVTINLDLDEKCAKADFTIQNDIRNLHLAHP